MVSTYSLFLFFSLFFLFTTITTGETFNYTQTEELLLPFSEKNINKGDKCGDLRRIVWKNHNNDFNHDFQRIGIFLQVGNIKLWEDMLRCTENIISVSRKLKFEVDYYIGTHSICEKTLKEMVEQVKEKEGALRLIIAQNFLNKGEDGGIFTKQLQTSLEASAFKLHSKTNNAWRFRATNSLCGSPSQVESIINNFAENSHLGMVGPLGLYISPSVGKEYSQYLFDETQRATNKIFQPSAPLSHRALKPFYPLLVNYLPPSIYNNYDSKKHLSLMAGTMFWFRLDQLDIAKLWDVTIKSGGFLAGYYHKGRIEHGLERFFGTFLRVNNFTIEQITPAPLPIAMYHPHHPYLTTTTTTTLKRQALSVSKGGFGSFDRPTFHIRKLQGEMAKKYGIYAFAYDHFWNPGSTIPRHLNEVPELMLQDGEPNIPFLFSWNYDSNLLKKNEEIMTERDKEIDYENHFEYLSKFLLHKNYVTIYENPVLVITNFEKVNQNDFELMLISWQKRAQELWGKKILIIIDGKWENINNNLLDKIHGVFSTEFNATEEDKRIRYWGTITGGENKQMTPEFFSSSLSQSFLAMTTSPTRMIDHNFFFLDSWNAWEKQAVLEPDSLYNKSFLEALRHSLSHIPTYQLQAERDLLNNADKTN